MWIGALQLQTLRGRGLDSPLSKAWRIVHPTLGTTQLLSALEDGNMGNGLYSILIMGIQNVWKKVKQTVGTVGYTTYSYIWQTRHIRNGFDM